MQNETRGHSTARRSHKAAGPWRSSATTRRNRDPSNTNARNAYKSYLALARAAALTGDSVETENFYQHAEHYFRLMRCEALNKH